MAEPAMRRQARFRFWIRWGITLARRSGEVNAEVGHSPQPTTLVRTKSLENDMSFPLRLKTRFRVILTGPSGREETQLLLHSADVIEKGTVIGGRYRLRREIGQGGMATIWEAEHMTLGSPVAVKFLYTGGPKADEMVGRFMREARVAASVRHRNVIEITDFGLSDDRKTPYMVMELLEGESLADRLDRQRLVDPRFATQIVWLALRGLAAVHDAGIVHRDLKPENIYLVTDSDGTYPKLLDFGVSRETQDDANITKEGILVGTPSYMSPEQARGLRDLDLRTDLYSMGVILYELLAGQLPFESENPGDLIVMITRDKPPPLRLFRQDLPDGLYEWIRRAMTKDRDKRFHDAREMRWALAEACKEFGFGADRETGVSRVSEFPGIGGAGAANVVIRPSRDSRVLPSDSPAMGNSPTEELSLEELASIQTREPVSTPESAAPTERPERRKSGGRGLLVAGVLVAAAIGVAAALVLPQSPFAQEGLRAVVLGTTAEEPVLWEPTTTEFPAGLLPPPTKQPGVHVLLYALPDGASARVAGVSVDGSEAWMPESRQPYQVEVISDGARVWAVQHPGDVDGEYEVWPMSPGELAEHETVVGEAAETEEAAEAEEPEEAAAAPSPAMARPRMFRGRMNMRRRGAAMMRR